MVIKIKKVWMGHASVRDYKVKECLKRGEDLIIDCQGHSKTFLNRELSNYLNSEHMTTVTSKFDGKQYDLVDFPWEAYGTN